jgi:hypothetical protein
MQPENECKPIFGVVGDHVAKLRRRIIELKPCISIVYLKRAYWA